MGTWALPQTEKQAKDLQKLMETPLPAKTASDQLYHLLGDDDLFDMILMMRREFGKDCDVRNLVKVTLKSFLNDQNNHFEPWDQSALKICVELCQSSS